VLFCLCVVVVLFVLLLVYLLLVNKCFVEIICSRNSEVGIIMWNLESSTRNYELGIKDFLIPNSGVSELRNRNSKLGIGYFLIPNSVCRISEL
jgi:hypothetical protein